MKHYTCEQCEKAITEKDVLEEAYPNIPSALKEAIIKFRKENNKEEEIQVHAPQLQLYHMVWEWKKYGSQKFHCGPLHEETEGEYFVRWAQGNV